MAGRWTLGMIVLGIVAVLRALGSFSADGSSMSRVFLAPPSSSPVQAPAAALRQTPGSPTLGAATGEALSVPTALSLGATFAAAAILCVASRGASARSARKTMRGVTIGIREGKEDAEKHGLQLRYPATKNFIPGEWGYSTKGIAVKPLPPPARQSLSRVEEAMATYLPSDFYKAPFVKLDPASVKEVSKPSDLPEYKKPKTGIRFEKEPGKKRPPTDTEKYASYIDKRTNLEATMDGKGADKDFMVDRSVMMLLLEFLDEKMRIRLQMKGSKHNPVDLIKISKKSGSKTLVMERLFEDKNLTAEWRPYRGAWKRSEVSNHGDFLPAWHRAATGDIHNRVMMVTGLWQVKGGRKDMPEPKYKISEFELGGLSFSARAPVHATSEGKTVELRHKNYYFRQDITMLNTYWRLLFGGADMLSIALHRSGKLIRILELTAAQLVEGKPEIVEASERRFGRLTALLKSIKEEVEKGGDGPFVLQMQDGELVLGKYERSEEPEEEEEVSSGEIDIDVSSLA